jgi:hypothetical protein
MIIKLNWLSSLCLLLNARMARATSLHVSTWRKCKPKEKCVMAKIHDVRHSTKKSKFTMIEKLVMPQDTLTLIVWELDQCLCGTWSPSMSVCPFLFRYLIWFSSSVEIYSLDDAKLNDLCWPCLSILTTLIVIWCDFQSLWVTKDWSWAGARNKGSNHPDSVSTTLVKKVMTYYKQCVYTPISVF